MRDLNKMDWEGTDRRTKSASHGQTLRLLKRIGLRADSLKKVGQLGTKMGKEKGSLISPSNYQKSNLGQKHYYTILVNNHSHFNHYINNIYKQCLYNV